MICFMSVLIQDLPYTHSVYPSLTVRAIKVKWNLQIKETGMMKQFHYVTFNTTRMSWSDWASGTASAYLQCQIEPLFTVSFIVKTLLEPQGASLLLFVTDNVELLLLVSSHNTEGQLGIFASVSVLCNKLQDLGKHSNIMWVKYRLYILEGNLSHI